MFLDITTRDYPELNCLCSKTTLLIYNICLNRISVLPQNFSKCKDVILKHKVYDVVKK